MDHPSRRQFLFLLSTLAPTMATAQIIGGEGWSIQGTDPVEI